jgi:hypothetical protein
LKRVEDALSALGRLSVEDSPTKQKSTFSEAARKKMSLAQKLTEELASLLSAETKRESFGTLAAGQQMSVSERGLGGTSQTRCTTSPSSYLAKNRNFANYVSF